MSVTPLLCDITGKPIKPSDKKSIQMVFGELDSEGRITQEKRIFNFSGDMRKNGKVDEAIVDFLIKK